jgi:hypothetical protein
MLNLFSLSDRYYSKSATFIFNYYNKLVNESQYLQLYFISDLLYIYITICIQISGYLDNLRELFMSYDIDCAITYTIIYNNMIYNYIRNYYSKYIYGINNNFIRTKKYKM